MTRSQATARPTLRARLLERVARDYLGKPDLADLLAIKFPDAAALGSASWNELMYRLGADRGARLHTLNVEITNRCNLRCTYCPVNRGMARPKVDLEFERFAEILARAPGVRTLLPFQWGEPLLHPRLLDMIALATGRGIRTFLTTNGTLLDASMQRALLSSGLARLTISVDGDDDVHWQARGVALAPIRERVRELRALRDATGATMRIDASMVVTSESAPSLDAWRRAWSPIVDRVQAIPLMHRERRAASCREPWRGLLVVLADGRVTTCCADSEGELALGDIRTQSAGAIFAGEAMARLRRAHAGGDLPQRCRDCGEFADARVSKRFQ